MLRKYELALRARIQVVRWTPLYRVSAPHGGAQREERLDKLEARIREQGSDPGFKWYNDLRRYGTFFMLVRSRFLVFSVSTGVTCDGPVLSTAQFLKVLFCLVYKEYTALLVLNLIFVVSSPCAFGNNFASVGAWESKPKSNLKSPGSSSSQCKVADMMLEA